jgi:large subunit ribosomal protein L23
MSANKSKHINYDTLLYPVVTEKTNLLSEVNQYAFAVRLDATKPEIKSAVESIFRGKVESITTQVRKGKNKVFRGRRGRQSDVKRAYVRITSGQRIDLTAGV